MDLNDDGVVSYVLLEGESSHQDSLIRTEWSIRTLKDGGVPIEKITGGIANWERSHVPHGLRLNGTMARCLSG